MDSILPTNETFTCKVRKKIEVLVKGSIPNLLIYWSQWTPEDKDAMWLKLLTYFSFPYLEEARGVFERYVTRNYLGWLWKIREEAIKRAGVEELDWSIDQYPPPFLSQTIWS